MEKLALLSESDIRELAIEAARTVAHQMIRVLSKPRPSSVTQTDAAEMLGVSAPTVKRMLDSGKLKLNGIGRIPIESVDAILNPFV
jgi:excisionase family DNA binding protein